MQEQVHEVSPLQISVPYEQLSSAALLGVIEEYVTREGTEYGEQDVPLAEKVRQVREQLRRGQCEIVFDGKSETVNLVPVKR